MQQQQGRWYIQLFGGLRVSSGASAAAGEGAPETARVITRFSTQKTGALLAYLAYFGERAHPREVLIEMLWPGENLQAGRHSLSMALSSLRHQLEPPGVPSGAVIIADRQNVRLSREAVTSDVALFDASLRTAARTAGAREKAALLADALARVSGPLLPGYYDEWVLVEQGQMQTRIVRAATTLADLWEKEGDLAQAAEAAQHAVAADPLNEKAQHTLLRLLFQSGQTSDALRRGMAFGERLQSETGDAPGPELRSLLRRIEREQQSPEPEADRVNETRRDARPIPAAASATPAPPFIASSPILPLPSGTVTFLRADFGPESEDDRNALPFLRAVFSKQGGYDLTPAAPANNLAFAFAAAGDALRAVAAALAPGEPPSPAGEAERGATLSPRFALHTGDVQANGNEAVTVDTLRLSPPAVHAARLLAAGHPGQTLVSEATVLLVRPASPQALPGAQFVDLGLFHLTPRRGDNGGDTENVAPERLFRVTFSHLPSADTEDTPPPRAEAAYQAALPLTFTRFFGREQEIDALTRLLQEPSVRLVTLTGPGGIGKTRLSLQVAQRLADAFRGRVCFAPLAETVSAQNIGDAIAAALKIAPSPQTAATTRIARHFENQRALLVLDNFEQLATDGAVVVQELLERIPGLVLLVTSRHLLRLEAEKEFAVGPLPTPAASLVRPEQLRLFESAQVFVDRAQAVRPDFQLTERNAPAIAALCERLEGLPLALELAASRAQVLTPAQMLTQLDNRLDFLVSRRAGHAARHRSLFAAIDWSVRLLDPALAQFFYRLAVFRGGWTWEAAEIVCGEPLALDYLAQLRECSLLLAEETYGGEIRFRMLETLRDYAWAQLPDDRKAPLQEKHRDFFLLVAEAEHARLATADQSRGLERLEAEHNNLRAALDFALAQNGETSALLRLFSSLMGFWMFRGYLREGADYIASALVRLDAEPADAAHRAGRAALLSGAAEIAFTRGDLVTARAQMEASLALRRALGDPRGIALALNNLGNIASGLNDLAVARALYEESLALQRELNHTIGVARTLNNLGALVARAQDLPASYDLFAESLSLRRQVGDPRGIAIALANLGNILCDLNRREEARACYVECLTLCQDLGEKNGIAYALDGFADLARAENRVVDAARFYGAASALREKAEIRLPPSEQARQKRGVYAAQSVAGKTAFANAFAAGQELSWEEACRLALQEPSV